MAKFGIIWQGQTDTGLTANKFYEFAGPPQLLNCGFNRIFIKGDDGADIDLFDDNPNIKLVCHEPHPFNARRYNNKP